MASLQYEERSDHWKPWEATVVVNVHPLPLVVYPGLKRLHSSRFHTSLQSFLKPKATLTVPQTPYLIV